MAFVYEISFDIPGSDFKEMRIGESVQVAVAYMRALLPNEPGFINSQAMYSISHSELTHILFQSTWEDWDSLLLHRDRSTLNEGHLLNEFKLDVGTMNLKTQIYEEIQ